MKDIDSTYQLPIFISSTEYNLIDLRAELAYYLKNLGYRPILSSAEGFPDKSPSYEPWESCLPVINQCFVMVLILDGRYGSPLEWPNYTELIQPKRKVSPTHAEYLYAHSKRKRMLVYVRRALLEQYQSYRKVMKDCKNNIKKAKQILEKTLPPSINFESLQFLSEVKTNKPIPWILGFDNVTEIKNEIHKKMLNDLAEVYLLREQHYETIIKKFSEILDELPEDKREKVLYEIGPIRIIIRDLALLKKEKKLLEEDFNKQSAELKANKELVEQYKREKKNTVTLEKTIQDKVKIMDTISVQIRDIDNKIIDTIASTPGFSTSQISKSFSPTFKTCSNCNKLYTHMLESTEDYCPHCHRNCCNNCMRISGNKCPMCGHIFEFL